MSELEITQAIEQHLIDSKFPLMHTRQLYGKIIGHWNGASGYSYRRLLRILNKMESQNLLYKNASPRDGAQWMLKTRDVKFSLPVSGESIMRNEIPF